MLYLKELRPWNALDGREIELALHARVSERETESFAQARIKQLATMTNQNNMGNKSSGFASSFWSKMRNMFKI